MFNRLHKILGYPLIVVLMIAGCTIDHTINAGSDPVTEQDLQAATQIIGESLSGSNSGVMLSMSDALTILAQSNVNPQATFRSRQVHQALQDEKSNYSHSYNPDNGVHAVSFRRETENPFFSKSVTDTLRYIYRDDENNFMENPLERRARIASINYTGRRQGTIATLHKKSSFTRQDTFLVAGFQDNASELTIEGAHYGSGSILINQPDQASFERSYELKITLLDIDMGKSVLDESGQVTKKATGTLSWQLQYIGGSRKGATLQGTIELNSDGTALLRFRSSPALYQINLSSGTVVNLDDAFEGRVTSVNVSDRQFTLLSGLKVYLSEDAMVQGANYGSLGAVRRAIGNDIRIWAEGEGTLQNGQFNSTKVAFNRENDDVGNNEETVNFKEQVTSVDTLGQTFTVAGKVSIRITAKTMINPQGDYGSLQSVMEALANKETVQAEGSAIIPPGSKNETLATKVVFNNTDN